MDQRGPVVLGGVVIDEDAHRARMAGIDRQHLLDDLQHRLVALLLRAREIRGGEQRLHALFLRSRHVGALLEQHGKLVPALLLAEQALEVQRRLAVARLDLERLAQRLLDLGRFRLITAVILGHRQVKRRGQLAIGRRIRLVEELLHELLPVVAHQADRRHRVLRRAVVGAELQRLLEALHRRGLEQEVVLQDLALLEEQLGAPRVVLGQRDLEIDELEPEVGLTARHVLLARLGQGRQRLRRDRLGMAVGEQLLQRRQRLTVLRLLIENPEVFLRLGHRLFRGIWGAPGTAPGKCASRHSRSAT